jgi:hypothetical protein
MRTSTKKSTSKSTLTASRSSHEPLVARSGAGFFAPAGVQMKMTVNQPGDKFEREADKNADQVVNGSMPPVSAKNDKLPAAPDQKFQKKEEDKVQRAAQPEEKIQQAGAPEEKVQKAPAPEEEKLQKAEAPEEEVQKKEEEKAPAATAPEEKVQKASAPDERVQKKEEEKILKVEAPEEKLQKAEDEKLQKAEDEKLQKAPEEEKLQRRASAGASPGAVPGDVQSSIRNKTTGGEPLSAEVRGHMESRFNADFSHIRIHKDNEAASLNNRLSARAFTYQNHIFFSRDQYQPGNSEGKHLLAHELTHTIQQGHATQQTSQASTTASTPSVQRLGIQDALDKFADWANAIPGFRMLTLVLGFNPISMRSVDRTPANLLRALIELIPLGNLITRVLDTHGVINKAAAWVQQKLETLGDIGSDLGDALRQFLDSLSWTDIFDLGGVWERAKRIFLAPIRRLINFGASLVSELLQMVKDAILRPLAALAKGTNGYDLLCVLLGQDPITGDPVPRTAENLLGGFMKFIGQADVWENIKKGNAVARAYAWFQGALSGLMGIVRAIPGTIMDTLRSLTFEDVVTVVGAFGKIAKAFLGIAGSFISWGLGTIWELLKIVVDVVKPGLMGYILKTGAALNSILKNPIPFMGNLINAAKLGFTNFAAHIGAHLKKGLIDWLTGALEGVYIPKAFSLLEFGKFALSILGITWAQIRAKIVKALGPSGEKIMQGLETAFDIVVALVKGGAAAVWDLIKEKLTDLKDQIVGGIIDFVTTSIVKKAVPKLIAMFIPGAGFISALISIYDTVMVFVQKIAKIMQVVKAFIDSIVTIAAGNIGGAAKRVESILGGLLSLAISFLAGFLGLGKVTDKIMAVVQKVRATVDNALDAAVGWIVGKAKKLFAKLFSKEKPDERTDEQKTKDKKAALAEAKALVNPKEFKEGEVRQKLGPIKSKYKLKSLDLVVDSKTETKETIHFAASASNTEQTGPITVDAPEADEPVGPLGIKRKQLGFNAATMKHFQDDPIWKKVGAQPGAYKIAKIDIRHRVSINDAIVATESTLAPKKVSEAYEILKAKQVEGQKFEPTVKSREGIIAAARTYLKAVNNDISNLFLGPMSENRSLQEKYDAAWTPSADDVAKQQQEFVNKWAFKENEEGFTITLERTSKRRGTVRQTKVLAPQ